MSETASPADRPTGGFMAAVIEYYRISILAVGALLIGGVVAFLSMPRSEDPEFDVVRAQVVTLWPGVAAAQVEELLTRPLEEAVEGLAGVRRIDSNSFPSLSHLLVSMNPDEEPLDVLEDIRDRVKEVRGELPDGIAEPTVSGFNTAAIPVIIVALYGSDDYRELERWADELKEELAAVDDVAGVDVEGLPERQIQVLADSERLSQLRVPLNRIRDVVAAENARIPGGMLNVGQLRYSVGNPNELESLEAIRGVVLGSYAGSLIQVGDVAQVVDAYQDDTYRVRANGQRAVLLAVGKVERTNTVAVAERVSAKAAELAKRLPPDLHLEVISDRGAAVAELLGNLGSNALGGGLVVMLMVTLFLGVRQAAVVSVSIPLSVLIAFLAMRSWDIDLNQISIFGLVLALGMLVDSALVVVENVAIHLESGDPLFVAVTAGTREVGASVISSALTTVAAFVPMLFLSGDIGSFISAMPWTLIFSLAASLLVALTVVPLLCYTMWRHFPHVPEHEEEGKIQHTVVEVARWTLRHRAIVLGLAAVALVISVLAIPHLGVEFFPKAEKRFFLINLRMPRNSNLATTDRVVAQVEQILAGEAAIRDYTANIGKGSPRIYYNELREHENASYAQILVNLKDEYEGTAGEYVAGLKPKLHQVAGASVEPRILAQGPATGAAIEVRVAGDDLEVLARLGGEIRQRIADVPGISDLRDSLGERIPRLAIHLSKEKAGLLGVDAFTFSSNVLTAVNGQTASRLREEEEEIPIVVKLHPDSLREVSGLSRLDFPSRLDGSMVPFRELASIQEEAAFGRISRRSGRRQVLVETDVAGRLATEVAADITNRLEGLSLPAGYELTVGGENEERDESFAGLGQALVLAVLLIYGILAIQFNSFVQPFVILLTVPFGIIGAVAGLFVTGNPFGFMAFIGIVSLTGIVINDAIVLTDFVNYQRRVEGKGLYFSLVEAVRRRFRPVVLTSVTTIAGMAPLAIWGGSLWAPLANALCFGLATSTVLILIICPTLYSLLVRSDERQRAYRLLPRLWRRYVRDDRFGRV